ncbi:MAG: hypothetical protein ACFHXK_16070 [bacterium]
MQYLSTLFLLALLSTGCGYIPFSSSELDGVVTPIPQSWSAVAEADIIQLETRPEDPYSVNLWVIEMDSNLYVFAGDNRTQWVENIAANTNVRLGHADKIYELAATQVSDETQFNAFAREWETKYGNLPRNMNVNEVYLYRLTQRD